MNVIWTVANENYLQFVSTICVIHYVSRDKCSSYYALFIIDLKQCGVETFNPAHAILYVICKCVTLIPDSQRFSKFFTIDKIVVYCNSHEQYYKFHGYVQQSTRLTYTFLYC